MMAHLCRIDDGFVTAYADELQPPCMTPEQRALLDRMLLALKGTSEFDREAMHLDPALRDIDGFLPAITTNLAAALVLLPSGSGFSIDYDDPKNPEGCSAGSKIIHARTKHGHIRAPELTFAIAVFWLRWEGETSWGRPV